MREAPAEMDTVQGREAWQAGWEAGVERLRGALTKIADDCESYLAEVRRQGASNPREPDEIMAAGIARQARAALAAEDSNG